MIDLEAKIKSKMKSDDRIIVLHRMEGKVPLSTAGLVDHRLFTGENKLHAKRELIGNNWRLEYDQGIVPPIFKQKFTRFNDLLRFVKAYYERRNVAIKEVID